MLSFIRAVFRQPHGGYIYREWGDEREEETKGDGAFDDFNEAI